MAEGKALNRVFMISGGGLVIVGGAMAAMGTVSALPFAAAAVPFSAKAMTDYKNGKSILAAEKS